MMTRNLTFCAAGALLGFLIGFFIANSVSHAPAAVASSKGRTPGGGTAAANAARPLDPNETNNELPPNHPDIGSADGSGGAGGSGTAAAATSPVAQNAMDKADRAPRDFAAQMEAAEVFYNFKDFDKAALYLNRALMLKPKDGDALTMMGNTKYDAGDYVAASSFYERALAVKPDDPNIRTDLGLTYFLRTPPDPDRAIVEYRKSLAVDPRHEKGWQNLAAAAIFKRDKRTAREALEKLANINPQNPALETMRQSAEALP